MKSFRKKATLLSLVLCLLIGNPTIAESNTPPVQEQTASVNNGETLTELPEQTSTKATPTDDENSLLLQHYKQANELGANPVYVYADDELPFALDLREDAEVARRIYIEPLPSAQEGQGVVVYSRTARYYTLQDPTSNFNPDIGNPYPTKYVYIIVGDLPVNLLNISYHVVSVEMEGGYTLHVVELLHHVYPADSLDANYTDNSAWLNAEYIASKLVDRTALEHSGESYEGTSSSVISAAEEWEQIKTWLGGETDLFEWKYNLPVLTFSDRQDSYWPAQGVNATLVAHLYGEGDYDGDGKQEYIVKGFWGGNMQTDLSGYIIVFKETDDGLRTLYVSESGSTNIFFAHGQLYALELESDYMSFQSHTLTVTPSAANQSNIPAQTQTSYTVYSVGALSPTRINELVQDLDTPVLMPGSVYPHGYKEIGLLSKTDQDAFLNLLNDVDGGTVLGEYDITQYTNLDRFSVELGPPKAVDNLLEWLQSSNILIYIRDYQLLNAMDVSDVWPNNSISSIDTNSLWASFPRQDLLP